MIILKRSPFAAKKEANAAIVNHQQLIGVSRLRVLQQLKRNQIERPRFEKQEESVALAVNILL